jgi:hypothetical protein
MADLDRCENNAVRRLALASFLLGLESAPFSSLFELSQGTFIVSTFILLLISIKWLLLVVGSLK